MATMVSIDRTKNRHRFYSVSIIPTLFGEFTLLCEWGRIGSPGTVRRETFDSEKAALDAERRIIKTRLRHGYV